MRVKAGYIVVYRHISGVMSVRLRILLCVKIQLEIKVKPLINSKIIVNIA
jgi:hypothetical protein